jgi:hypothetical protein
VRYRTKKDCRILSAVGCATLLRVVGDLCARHVSARRSEWQLPRSLNMYSGLQGWMRHLIERRWVKGQGFRAVRGLGGRLG